MKLIKVKNGYINADMMEAYTVEEHDGYFDIRAYAPPHGNEYYRYEQLGRCNDETTAYARLNTLAELLAYEKSGIFDVMHVWESDYDEPN